MAKVPMPVDNALQILTSVHTRDDDATGFAVEMSVPNPDLMVVSPEDYTRAWKAVRAYIHLQIEPKQ
jgi:hypothetical protein